MKLPRLRRKGNAYYYDAGGKPRRWVALGSDEAVALKRYRRLMDGAKPERGTVGELLDEFIDYPRATWSQGTRTMYEVYARHLRRVFGDCEPAMVSRGAVLGYLDVCQRKSARAEISVLRQVMERAVRRGLCETNPCIGARAETPVVSKRTRLLTDNELASVMEHGRPLLRVALRIMYLTGLRSGNVILVRWDDFAEGGSIVQQKTKRSGPRQRYVLTDDLRDALDAARALQGRIATLTVLAERGRPLREGRLGDLWREACAKAGIDDAQLRDMRAKSASDADAEGQNAQRLLGHTSPETTKVYLRGRQVVTVEPVKRRKL